MQLFNLPNWKVTASEGSQHDSYLMAVYTLSPTQCPHCLIGTRFQGYGTKEQLFMDLPAHGKRVGVSITRRKYRCTHCQRTFYERLPDMDDRHHMTKRLVEYIQQEALRKDETFIHLAETVGVSEGTIRNIFHAYITHLEATTPFVTPEVLGLDEIDSYGVLSNVKDRTIVDLLRNRKLATVQNRLLRFENRHQIALVCMDMWQPYKLAVQATLPQAHIVVDKFHVVRLANQAVDYVRKALRDEMEPRQRKTLKMHDRYTLLKRRQDLTESQRFRLEVWTRNVPLLAQVYDLKESFYDLWDSTDRQLAKERYEAWRKSIPSVLDPAFADLTRALSNWEQEIFAYFDYDVTNAYTESLNALIRAVDRAHKGLSFPVLRAKMLFSAGLGRVYRPKYQRPSADKATTEDQSGADQFQESLGVEISTLIQQVIQGEW